MRIGTFLSSVMALCVLACGLLYSPPASAQAWSLTSEQRRAFLYYYAPIIFKRGNENDGNYGRDWITNFDFDQDFNFSNNKFNWKTTQSLVLASRNGPSAYSNWRLRPTLYTAIIEFMDGPVKHAVLIYHVYHAMEENAVGKKQIHDWEEIEIHLQQISGMPGQGESVKYAVVVAHQRHVVRLPGISSGHAHFMLTPTGKHLLTWQAEWSGKLGAAHGQEIRFVDEEYSAIQNRMAYNQNAEVDVNNDSGGKKVHYIFVPKGSGSAVSMLGAQPLSYSSADALSSKVDNDTFLPWGWTKRVQYELQDLSDILTTHWLYGPWQNHWLDDKIVDILLESPIVNEAGGAEVPAGLQRFAANARDIEDASDGRDGYPDKGWLWGSYNLNDNAGQGPSGNGGGFADGLSNNYFDSRSNTRITANGIPGSLGAYHWQHDYFVHDGYTDNTDTMDPGYWLPGQWYTAANGGFDGRWTPLFDDRAGQENSPPISALLYWSPNPCEDPFIESVVIHVTGGQQPYLLTWNSGTMTWQATAPPDSQGFVEFNQNATVTVQSADGQSTVFGLYTQQPQCYPWW